jgi:1-acyl-sn-glycerol-3-phosphate acyltransferase
VTIWVLVVSIIGILISLPRPKDARNLYFVSRLFGYGALFIFNIKLKLVGREILDYKRPCLFIANHQSNLDMFAWSSIVPPNTVSLGKKSILYIPFFGQLYWILGNVAIDRKNRTKAFQTMNSLQTLFKKNHTSVVIMPEGTRSYGRGLLPFKRGAFHTAIQNQIPIVPVCFNSFDKNIDLGSLKKNIILAKILDPIETKDLTKNDVTELSLHCHRLMKETIEELDQLLISVD